MDIVGDINVLLVACEIIKLKFGSTTRGLKSEDCSNIIQKVVRRIFTGCFKFKNVHRVEVFKPNKRFLIIGNFKDRVVHQVITMILSQIFEPRFLKTSHGFRATKGCHSALKQIQHE
jgi:nicotine oxidoreductase